MAHVASPAHDVSRRSGRSPSATASSWRCRTDTCCLRPLLVYGLPLAGLLGGALAGLAALGSDLGAAIGAAAGAVSVLLAAPALRSRVERATLRRMQLRPSADAHTHSL